MRIKEIFESTNKHITFCFGRMNPPTIGHKKLMDAMASVGGDMKVFVSQTQDKKKNPLDYSTKIKFIRAIIPEYANDVVEDPGLNTIGKVASHLYNQGYRHATFVAGSDRLDEMSNLLKTYNGVEGKAHGFYKFDTLEFKSSGDREDGAEGVEGVSASNARAAAATGDFEQFATSTGAGKYAKPLYDAVRKGMGISESVSEEWSKKYKSSINCSNPKGFSQKAHCAGKKKNETVDEGYGRYYCSTDKKWKTRQGPKQKRAS